MLVVCKQSSYILHTVKQCKTINQLHQVHAQSITRGLFSLHPSSSLTLLTTILHSFTSLLSSPPPSSPLLLHYALSLFNLIPNPSTFCYNLILRAHTLLSFPLHGLQFFLKMRRSSLPPDAHTFPFAIKASAQLISLPLAQTLHSQSLKFGFSADVFVSNTLIHAYSVLAQTPFAYKVFDEMSHRDVVSYNALIDCFVKVGEIGRARALFDNMPVRDAVSWGTMLAGYARIDEFREVIELFDRMVDLDVRPDNVALVSVLSACGRLGELEKGKDLHCWIKRNRIRVDAFLATGLVDFYAKCGCIETAREVFELSRDKNVFTWNVMLVGLAIHGCGKLLLDYFSRMVQNGVEPDGVTFLGVLLGCSHAGLVDEARWIFGKMESVYGVCRELKHYGCMADLLARAGLIREAVEMIEVMPMRGDVFVWGGLLGGCKIHGGNVEVAEKAARNVMEIKPEDGGVYSVLANVYANAEQWDELAKVRKGRDSRRVKKNAGCSWIMLNGMMHEFIAGDRLHPQTEEIHMVLNNIGLQQFEAAWVPFECPI